MNTRWSLLAPDLFFADDRRHDDSADRIAALAGLSDLANKRETIGSVKDEETELSACSNGSLGWNRITGYLYDLTGNLHLVSRSVPPKVPSGHLRCREIERNFMRRPEMADFGPVPLFRRTCFRGQHAMDRAGSGGPHVVRLADCRFLHPSIYFKYIWGSIR
jgi:hypothetical protein